MTKPKTADPQKWDDKWLTTRGDYHAVIDPQLAQKLLELNVRNRPPKQLAISRYARDMVAKRWDGDASDIKFSSQGKLIDGQNRLIACMVSGASFPTLVRTGLNPDSRRHVDTGVKRTAADMLRMEGVGGSATSIGAAVTLWVRYADRVQNHKGKRLSNQSGGGMRTQTLVLTHDEILEFLGRHPTIQTMAPRAEAIRRQIMPAIPTSAILAFLAMAAEKDEAETNRFADRLISGDYGGPGDPMVALVQYAARVRGNVGSIGSPGHRGRVAQESHLQAMSRVWNATRKGEKIEGRLHIKISDRLVMPQ